MVALISAAASPRSAQLAWLWLPPAAVLAGSFLWVRSRIRRRARKDPPATLAAMCGLTVPALLINGAVGAWIWWTGSYYDGTGHDLEGFDVPRDATLVHGLHLMAAIFWIATAVAAVAVVRDGAATRDRHHPARGAAPLP